MRNISRHQPKLKVGPLFRHVPHGDVINYQRLYNEARDYERQAGLVYYDQQRAAICAAVPGVPVATAVGIFAAVSPNLSEDMNYVVLKQIIGIVRGQLPEDCSISAYGPNKAKALRIARGALPEQVLGGRKVTAFYANTMQPDDGRVVTIDGHMYNAWTGKRLNLVRAAGFDDEQYAFAAQDLREVARGVGISAPRLQSILWLVWRRKQGILQKPSERARFYGQGMLFEEL